MSDAQIVSRFERLGYKLTIDQIAFTTEAVEDFYEGREKYWSGPGKLVLYEPPGILIVEAAQPRPYQPTRDIIVISLGYARAVMGVLEIKIAEGLPRYARDLE